MAKRRKSTYEDDSFTMPYWFFGLMFLAILAIPIYGLYVGNKIVAKQDLNGTPRGGGGWSEPIPMAVGGRDRRAGGETVPSMMRLHEGLPGQYNANLPGGERVSVQRWGNDFVVTQSGPGRDTSMMRFREGLPGQYNADLVGGGRVSIQREGRDIVVRQSGPGGNQGQARFSPGPSGDYAGSAPPSPPLTPEQLSTLRRYINENEMRYKAMNPPAEKR